MASPTLVSLQTQLDSLQVRLTALDGVGSSNPANSFQALTTKQFNTSQTDLNQVLLSIQVAISSLTTQVAALSTQITNLINNGTL